MERKKKRALSGSEKNGKTHKRTFFMAVTSKNGPLVKLKQLPVFKGKKPAKSIAEKVKGKVVKAQLVW